MAKRKLRRQNRFENISANGSTRTTDSFQTGQDKAKKTTDDLISDSELINDSKAIEMNENEEEISEYIAKNHLFSFTLFIEKCIQKDN